MTRRELRDWLKRRPMLLRLGRLARALATPLGRGRLRAERQGARLFQPATVTWADRHPALFAAVAQALVDRPGPRLLSFGCSTGEEALTLARYLPGATIDGIDANAACIARARRAAARDGVRVRFACADAPDALGVAYDAVLCLSVLRHGILEAERPHSCAALIPFARFATAVAALDAVVAPGGLLVLWGAHFRFADTATAAGYTAVPVPGTTAQDGPFYGPEDTLLVGATTRDFIWRKAQ